MNEQLPDSNNTMETWRAARTLGKRKINILHPIMDTHPDGPRLPGTQEPESEEPKSKRRRGGKRTKRKRSKRKSKRRL